MVQVRELLGRNDVVKCLQHLADAPETALHRKDLEDRVLELGVGNPTEMVDLFMDTGLVVPYGERLGISIAGHRTNLLIRALEGADIEDTYRQLRQLSGHPEMYELVREGMTTTFIRSLIDRPGFRRLYICSPWVNPSEKDAAVLKYAFLTALKRNEDPPELLVVTRPPDLTPPETRNGLKPFRDVGAQVFFNPRLHSKLYIREPDRRGGLAMAIVGSQNLTRSTNLELGIRINGDTRLVDQLIRYFLEITSQSSEQLPAEE
jgi:hypothetical protein